MKIRSFIKWTGRIIGLLFLLFVLLSIGEEPIDFSSLTPTETFMFVALSALILGILVEYLHTLAGALLIIFGYLAMMLIEERLLIGPLFPVIFLVGITHLILYFIPEKS